MESLTGTLSSAGVLLPGTPQPDHELLIACALARRQPFDTKGDGYRDALLWHIVRDLAAAGNDVALVSGDKAAFADKREDETKLAAALNAEIVELGSTARLFPHARASVDGLELVAVEARETAEAIFARGGPAFAEKLRLRLVEQLTYPVHKWITRNIVNPFSVERTFLGLAYDVIGIHVLEARGDDHGRLEVSVHLDVRQQVTIAVDWERFSAVADLGSPTVSSEDDEFASVEVEARVIHLCRLLLDPLGDVIVEAEPVEVVSAKLA